MSEAMSQFISNPPLLSLLIISLPVGAALIWMVPNAKHARIIALITALVDLVIAVMVLIKFDPADPGYQLTEKTDWIPTLNIHYALGIDGISVLFLPLTIMLFIGVMAASWNQVRHMTRLFYSLMLLLESTTIGVFCALDTILFFLFWELALIPLFFLISLWGIGADRRFAAVKYTLFMLIGGVPLLFGFILLAFTQATGSGTEFFNHLNFDYTSLVTANIALEVQVTVFFLLLLGFAIKTPVFPLHTWLPVVAMEGPVAVTALVTGLKLGAYGLIRFVVPLAPDAAQQFHWLLAGLGVFGILYGALVAMRQTNLRKMLAFSSMSHVGLVVLGIASFSINGIQGAVFQLLNFIIVSGGLFLLISFLHARVGTTDIIGLGGVARTMPLLTAGFFVFGIASMGIPGTNGFPAEFLIIASALKHHTGAGLAALVGVILTAGYFLNIYRQAFLGPVTSNVVASAIDLRKREIAIIVIMGIYIFVVGFHPNFVLDITRTASEGWLAHTKAAF